MRTDQLRASFGIIDWKTRKFTLQSREHFGHKCDRKAFDGGKRYWILPGFYFWKDRTNFAQVLCCYQVNGSLGVWLGIREGINNQGANAVEKQRMTDFQPFAFSTYQILILNLAKFFNQTFSWSLFLTHFCWNSPLQMYSSSQWLTVLNSFT